jgi:hypothetical protein
VTSGVNEPDDLAVAGGERLPRRRGLEAQANVVRARLLARLDVLREKKRLLVHPTEEARRHPDAALAAALAAIVVLGAGAGVVGYRHATRKERALRVRVQAWMTLLTHPERAVSQRGFARRVLEHAATTAMSAVMAAVGKHYVERLLSKPDERSVPGGLVRSPDPFGSAPSRPPSP